MNEMNDQPKVEPIESWSLDKLLSEIAWCSPMLATEVQRRIERLEQIADGVDSLRSAKTMGEWSDRIVALHRAVDAYREGKEP